MASHHAEAKVIPLGAGGALADKTAPWEVEPFIRVPLALALLGIKSTHRDVYQALCFRWWKVRNQSCAGVTIASLRELREEAGVSIKEVRGAVKALEEVGWIYREGVRGQRTAFVAMPLPAELLEKASRLARRGDHALEMEPAEIHALLERAHGR